MSFLSILFLLFFFFLSKPDKLDDDDKMKVYGQVTVPFCALRFSRLCPFLFQYNGSTRHLFFHGQPSQSDDSLKQPCRKEANGFIFFDFLFFPSDSGARILSDDRRAGINSVDWPTHSSLVELNKAERTNNNNGERERPDDADDAIDKKRTTVPAVV